MTLRNRVPAYATLCLVVLVALACAFVCGSATACQPRRPAATGLTIEVVRAERPHLQLVYNFLSDDETSEVLRLAQGRFEASKVVSATGRDAEDLHRTSTTCYLKKGENSTVRAIEVRAAAVARFPVENVEAIQLTRYTRGQQYKPHYDYFVPNTAAHSHATSHGHTKPDGSPDPNQRCVTLFVYLTQSRTAAPSDGGTHFPKINTTLKPPRGTAVLFTLVDKHGQEDPNSMHAGLPVRGGAEKVGLNIWVRKNAMPALT